jgi:DNA invertase Pin-like site-specific DNA recombinase
MHGKTKLKLVFMTARGIAKVGAAGVYKGRPASIDAGQVRAMKAEGKGASEIAKALKIGRASVYRVLEANYRRAAGRFASKLLSAEQWGRHRRKSAGKPR